MMLFPVSLSFSRFNFHQCSCAQSGVAIMEIIPGIPRRKSFRNAGEIAKSHYLCASWRNTPKLFQSAVTKPTRLRLGAMLNWISNAFLVPLMKRCVCQMIAKVLNLCREVRKEVILRLQVGQVNSVVRQREVCWCVSRQMVFAD